MAKRNQIEMNGAENFVISATNPNAGAGLPGCACGSFRCPGPFLVFPSRLAGGRRQGFVSVSVACAKKGVLKVESGGEIGQVGNVRPGEDGPPAPIELTEGSKNPYHQTGIDPHAKPLNDVVLEQHLADRADEQAQAEKAAGLGKD